jgi:hypothetical protein
MVIADTVREVSSLKEDVPCISPHYNQHGFPSTFKLSSIKQMQAANDTHKSLFAQQFDSNNPNSDYSLKENTNKSNLLMTTWTCDLYHVFVVSCKMIYLMLLCMGEYNNYI